jgi:hypothetical protein
MKSANKKKGGIPNWNPALEFGADLLRIGSQPNHAQAVAFPKIRQTLADRRAALLIIESCSSLKSGKMRAADPWPSYKPRIFLSHVIAVIVQDNPSIHFHFAPMCFWF